MKFYRLTTIIIIILLSASCSKYDKLLKDGSTKDRLEAANSYYEKGNYFKALQLYDQLVVELRGRAEFEDAYYKYCRCNYEQEQFLAAAYYFKNLAKTLPTGKYAEESLYMAAYCQYLMSPDSELDQGATEEALKEFQLFVNKYPKSNKIEKCNELMDELRFKIENKDYATAVLYYKIEEYKSAVLSFKNLIKEFPATKYREESLFYILKAEYYYASKSIESKKKERFNNAEESYNFLIAQYPNSKHKKEAESFNNKIKAQLKKLN